MTILVTGAAGFIGSNFVLDWFSKSTEEVVSLDLLTYAGKLENLSSLSQNPHHHFVKGNIGDRDLVSSLLKKYQIRAVLNFAAESHVDRSSHGPGDFIETNIVGTYHLLESVRSYWNNLDETSKKTFRLLHVSTDEVYGDIINKKSSKESDSYNPSSPYSASKASGDLLIKSYIRTYKIPAIITNCCNNYGPNQYPEKLIPVVINSIKNNKPIPIYGNGGNVRDWLHVEDHAEAILAIYQKGKIGETYCIGGNMELSNYELVHAICDIYQDMYGGNPKSLITYVEDRKGHDLRYAIDPYKLNRELDWTPKHGSFSGLIEGLTETIKWYMSKK